VFALQVLVMQWPIHWGIKYSFILVVSFVLLFVTYHYWVRSTFIGKALNGQKFPRTPLLAVWKSSLARDAVSATKIPESAA
jgi:hypothetical protein